MSHFISWLQLCGHPFLTDVAQLFFSPSRNKSNHRNPPKNQHLILKCYAPDKVGGDFHNIVWRGNTRKQDCIARFLYVPPLHYKPRIKQQKYMRTTMVNVGSSNPHSKYKPNTVVRTFPTLRHPLAPSRQGALTLRLPGNHFIPTKSPISTRTRQVRKSPKTYISRRKAGPFFILPTLVSRVLHHHWR